MKVLFVLNGGLSVPGPSNHLIEAIIQETARLGANIQVIEKQPRTEFMDQELLSLGKISFSWIPFVLAPKNNLVQRYLADLRYAFVCSRHFRMNRDSDVVFLQSSIVSPFLVFLLKNLVAKPIVYNVQDIWPVNAALVGILKKDSLRYKVFSWLQRYAYNNADTVVTISEDMKNTLIREGVAPQKIEVIHNWSYSDETAELPLNENQFVKQFNVDVELFNVVYAGNIGVFQNVEIIVKAANLLRQHADIKFHIIGEGARKSQLEEYVRANFLSNITFYPLQPPEIASDVYRMASVNIIPLAEGVVFTALPSKTAICLSSGKPIIACVDIESHFAKMISECDRCAVAHPNDPSKLAELIYQAYQSRNVQCSPNIRSLFISKFSRVLNSKKYASILERRALS